MTTICLSHYVSAPIRHVYDVVAGIERYPEFVPGFKAVRIEGHRNGALIVRQILGLKGLRETFRTFATFDPPHRIHITTREGPFRFLDQWWRFDEVTSRRTRVTLKADYEFDGPIMKRLGDRMFPGLMRQSMEAFLNRVRTTEPRP